MIESPNGGFSGKQKRRLSVAAVAALCFGAACFMTAYATHDFFNPKDVVYVTPPAETHLSIVAIVLEFVRGGIVNDASGKTARLIDAITAAYAVAFVAAAGWSAFAGPFVRRGMRAGMFERWIGTASVVLLGIPGFGLELVHMIFGGDATVERGFYLAFAALWVAVINDGLPDRMPRIELEPQFKANISRAAPSPKKHRDLDYFRAMFDATDDPKTAPPVPENGATGQVAAEANARGDSPA